MDAEASSAPDFRPPQPPQFINSWVVENRSAEDAENTEVRLLERFQQIANLAVERRVLSSHVFDFPDRMDDGRVMLAAKAAADLGE